MIRGFMKTTSLTTLVAAAGIFVGNSAYAPANAADLGGGCCADLEERVAELEATTARKGNRVVSLQIYGQVNKALLIWDDGVDGDAYVVDNDYSGTRMGLKGSGTMRPGWTAGYNIEFQFVDAALSGVTATDDEGSSDGDISFRLFDLYVENDRFGRLSIGQGNTASNGITEIVLGSALSDSSAFVGPGSFEFRDGIGGFSDITVGDVFGNLDGASRDDRIRYDTPSLHGFIVSASWGDDDIWDIALRFKKEWNSIRLAAGIAYTEFQNSSDDVSRVGGSISIMHVPTGIYGAFATASDDSDAVNEDAEYYYLQLGLERRLLPYGTTTFYADYIDTEVGAGGVDPAYIFDVEGQAWGFGVVQKYDGAAMEVYAQARFYEVDATLAATSDPADLEDLTTVLIGSRIKF